jgi:translation elongation factor EF-4
MKKYKPEYIRNFSIIAHIDHGRNRNNYRLMKNTFLNVFIGKSTLADRLLEITGRNEISVLASIFKFLFLRNNK